MKPEVVDIAIVGAGIGGLAAAVALGHAGLDVHVFERARAVSEVGGAVVIREPSVRLLQSWGLEDFFVEAVAVDLLQIRDGTGALVHTAPADFIGDGQAYSTHRADIHGLLLDALAPHRLHLGRVATSADNDVDEQHASIRFTDGTHVSARLVVGADGIRSVTRAAICQDEPIFAGLTTLRGLAPASALPAGVGNDRITLWAHGAKTMIALPLRGGTHVALDTVIKQDTPPKDLWNTEVPTAVLLEQFAEFDESLRHLIAAGTTPVRAHPVYDRDPIQEWADGRIVLVGDAAHPMAPRHGQGANQAIQDAGALANALVVFGLDDVAATLGAYQAERVGPATALQLASRHTPTLDDATEEQKP